MAQTFEQIHGAVHVHQVLDETGNHSWIRQVWLQPSLVCEESMAHDTLTLKGNKPKKTHGFLTKPNLIPPFRVRQQGKKHHLLQQDQ